MPIPDFQQCMRPFLAALTDGETHPFNDGYEAVCDFFNLSDEERRELLPSGKQTIVRNRCGWARTYMKKAGLLTSPARSQVKITEQGLQVLNDQPEYFNVRYLKTISPEFVEFHSVKPKPPSPSTNSSDEEESTDPIERLENVHAEIQASLASDLLQLVKDSTPLFMEQLVVDLMHKMGYGGWSSESGATTKYSADGGIDGFINEDPLGLESIYLQAKRFTSNSVGRPEIQAFVGALEMRRARKGVFITTSQFSREALEYIGMIEKKVVLIDGKRLADLMVKYDLGVTPKESYQIKTIDTDYFSDDE